MEAGVDVVAHVVGEHALVPGHGDEHHQADEKQGQTPQEGLQHLIARTCVERTRSNFKRNGKNETD